MPAKCVSNENTQAAEGKHISVGCGMLLLHSSLPFAGRESARGGLDIKKMPTVNGYVYVFDAIKLSSSRRGVSIDPVQKMTNGECQVRVHFVAGN